MMRCILRSKKKKLGGGREKIAMEESMICLGVELESNKRLVVDLKHTLEEEKSNSKRLGKQILLLANDLMIFDLVVEDLELDGKKKARLIQELEVKLEEESTYMLEIIIVVISVLVVLLASIDKVWEM